MAHDYTGRYRADRRFRPSGFDNLIGELVIVLYLASHAHLVSDISYKNAEVEHG